ncbi:MAG: DNA mismatch repair protein MutS [Oscillospiraceae bacterium]|jgi:DNA mismatch repair protein MutS|nr:DNA mismatch repair protein MutS [Oscillospiraceae bacterium]
MIYENIPASITPMMRQYLEAKAQNPDAVLFWRLGDFYEMFFDDAVTVSRALGLTLTARDCGLPERAAMCGVPHHAIETYLARLIKQGFKVAVCEQMEDPAQAKGLVRREVTRILTPGTVIEGSMLDDGRNNFLAVLARFDDRAGLCFADVSTGAFSCCLLQGAHLGESIRAELARINPSELLLNEAAAADTALRSFANTRLQTMLQALPESYFDPIITQSALEGHFGQEALEPLLAAQESIRAAGACLRYLAETQRGELGHMRTLEFYGESAFMRLDAATLRNLELTETLRSREKRGSLLWVMDCCRTAMGKRTLRSWLEKPLLNIGTITRRHSAVEELVNAAAVREDLLLLLASMQDMERLITRIVYASANAQTLRALAVTAAVVPKILDTLIVCKSTLLAELFESLDPLEDVSALVERAISDEPPASTREGGMIRDGFHKELDELRALIADSKGYLAGIAQKEAEKTGIRKLKIGYNRVYGYYLEVPNSQKTLVPEHYIRKQTLTDKERYITQELKELESKVLGAQERITRIEFELFERVRTKTAAQVARVQKTARALAELDALCALAQTAAQANYVRPDMCTDGVLHIVGGRHPVVERMQGAAPFVPNDTDLNTDECRCMILTGPNMAGKSTYMRQVALICLLAQAGSFVPASSARLTVLDGIYTRIGASDDLSAGQSTFLVEMSEVAAILSAATPGSLLILDEIGRGTSTYDGMSIARAVLEHCADKKKLGAKTLFATHYHELTDLEDSIAGVKNYNIAVKKRGDELTFLRKIVPGGADDSYGIEAAKLAGVPESVVKRARVVLAQLERDANVGARHDVPLPTDDTQISFAREAQSALLRQLARLDVNTLTPFEAMQTLFDAAQSARSCAD